MKKILLILFMIATPVFSQVSENKVTGWRNEGLLSYCEEYDLMIENGGHWILNWNESKDEIKKTLNKDGFYVEETDSTLEWSQSQIYSCSIRFKPNGKIAFTNIVIVVTSKHGPDIFNSLKNKNDLLHGDSGKFQIMSESTGYSWIDNKCRKPIYTLLAKKLLQDGKYFITLFSSKIGN